MRFLGHNTVVVRSCEEDTLDTTSLLSLATESLSEEMIRQIFAGIRLIITLALRQPSLKAEVSRHLISAAIQFLNDWHELPVWGVLRTVCLSSVVAFN